MRGNAHVPAPRTGADRKLDCIRFVWSARPEMIATYTAESLAALKGVPVAFAADDLAKWRQESVAF